MISFECKNCGGELELVSEGIGRCTSCRSKQPMPRINDEKFNRANRLRLENVNFDDAREIYETIVNDNPNEAEAYWGIVLCRYGIEYVKDPYTDEYKPTCNRIIESSIQEDADFKKAVSCASDEENREYYINQARMIDKIQQRILSIARTEQPYDIFISFKASDDVTKEETEDSKRATSMYYALKEKGYRVFFSKETLKDKAGEEYEPYIYAALKSAKVMILVGTKAEYMNAKWVKNEWRRFNKMRLDGEKKLILPAYAKMDPYEFPFELNGMQALSMERMDFLMDLLSNIERFIGESAKDRNDRETSESVNKILEQKGFVSNKYARWNENGKKLLEMGHYNEALLEFNKAIEENPNYANAYWNRLLTKLKISEEQMKGIAIDFTDEKDYIMAITYAEGEERERYVEVANISKKNLQLQNDYEKETRRIYIEYTSNNENSENPLLSKRREKETAIEKGVEQIKKTYPKMLSTSIMFTIIYGVGWITALVGAGLVQMGVAAGKPVYWIGFGICILVSLVFIWICVPTILLKLIVSALSPFIAIIATIICIISVIVGSVKNKKFKKVYDSYMQDVDEYEKVLDDLGVEYKKRLYELNKEYDEKNKNTFFTISKGNAINYTNFEQELRDKYIIRDIEVFTKDDEEENAQ